MSRLLERLLHPFRQIAIRVQWKLLMVMSNEARIRFLRRQGVRIGEDCLIYTTYFSTEPYLVEIGNHVAVSSGVHFSTHDASGWLFEEHPDMDVFGDIRIGDNTYIGINCTILPGTRIGANCVIGAGAVVRGTIPDGSVAYGNPARVIMKTSLLEQMLVHHRHRLDTRHFAAKDKEAVLRRHFGLPPGERSS